MGELAQSGCAAARSHVMFLLVAEDRALCLGTWLRQQKTGKEANPSYRGRWRVYAAPWPCQKTEEENTGRRAKLQNCETAKARKRELGWAGKSWVRCPDCGRICSTNTMGLVGREPVIAEQLENCALRLPRVGGWVAATFTGMSPPGKLLVMGATWDRLAPPRGQPVPLPGSAALVPRQRVPLCDAYLVQHQVLVIQLIYYGLRVYKQLRLMCLHGRMRVAI